MLSKNKNQLISAVLLAAKVLSIKKLRFNVKSEFKLKELLKSKDIESSMLQFDIEFMKFSGFFKQYLNNKKETKTYTKNFFGTPDLSIEQFEIVKLMGKQQFIKMYLAKNKVDNKYLILKSINKYKAIKGNNLTQMLEEKKISPMLKNSCLREVECCFASKSHLFFGMKYMKGGDLSEYMNGKEFSENVAREIMAQILIGMSYLHDNQIIHRDLRPENIVIDKKGFCYIGDFGLSRILN